ncbi:hypothetical protein HJB56_05070 [Rhizobium lentis]|uniref:phage major capsid protein n=1 Tax=Rhizobium lentis TaxID=1138194 RepID=UPI001C82ED08|nr:hypothetical protein [Rhizobium lentis]MBX5082158.1 hypothetical protein [Rhizobium lentis]MBX5094868.1 hypothetical protein [Rhizobium lentis]MBX5119593.1 hypothetical protein [Rhizobium lentis]
MKNHNVLAVACTLALAFLAFVAVTPSAFAAVPDPHVSLTAASDFFSNHAHHFAVTLAAMRADLDKLTQRAAAKIAEITDDTPVEAARAIQDEHNSILADADKLRGEIKKKEEEEAAATRSQQNHNPEPTPEALAAGRAADILDIGTRAGMATDAIQQAIRSNVTLDSFRAQAFDHMAGRQQRTSPSRVITDERETRRNARIEALSYRLGAPIPAAGPSAAARGHMNDGLVAIAAEAVEYRGYPRNARDIEDIFTRAAHTTSDFPAIMEGAINRTLEGRYALAQPTYRRIARQRNFRDFRPHTVIKTGDFPMLKQVLEDGEIKYGTLTEGKETLQVLSYARAISVSRQLMINDDLGAIQDMLSSYGTTVALFEEITFYSSAFNAKLADGQTVFHASHNNLGAAAAIDVDPVSLGRAAMAKQKSLDGNPLLANAPAIILTGPDTITKAEKLVASITPATVATVNIFSGRLTPIDTAQIADNAWYLFPNPDAGSNYRWGYLEGYEAPRVRIESPFGRQGMAMSVEHDFGCGATDYRYGFKNPGA